MIIPTARPEHCAIEVNIYDSHKYIQLWQDSDLVIVYGDQVDALIEELKKYKENA